MATPTNLHDGNHLPALANRLGLGPRVSDAILGIVAAVPTTCEPAAASPKSRAQALAMRAARATATISGGAALVPGPAGMLTLLPDLIAVWKVQAQMVADIAGVYGQTATLTREQMVYCLFKHMVSHGMRDLVVRTGERFLVQNASLKLLQRLVASVGVKVTQRAMGKAIARYAPVVGAAGVAAYAFYDTKRVAATAIELFAGEVVLALDGAGAGAMAGTGAS